ncbi:MAG: hypothetical protein J6Y32_04030 [Bacteroidales bacterium]|nr:hypothetical protein [Bacteroidales bacterium]
MKSFHTWVPIVTLLVMFVASCGTTAKKEKAVKEENPIPEKILGCKFGRSLFSVKNTMDRTKLVREKEHELTYRDISFGGSDWDYASFIFNVKNQLQEVYFQRHHELETRAMSDYQGVAALLMMKYSIQMVPFSGVKFDTLRTDGLTKGGLIFSKDNRSVTARMNLGQSYSGKLLWYCNLIYEDRKYSYENIKKALKEL